ncbi:MAG: DUF2270 domain-containing protein [Chloroflexota bacterium]
MADGTKMDDLTAKHKLETTNHIQAFVIHYFRAEVSRETAWHHRLDVTFDWAVVATGGMVSLALSGPEASHIILLATVLVILFFLNIEARRYRVYAKLKYRVRLLEEDYIAPLFNHIAKQPQEVDDRPQIDPGIINSITDHESPISHLEATAIRMRSNYIYLLLVVYLVWSIKILNNRASQSWWEAFSHQAQVADIPGGIVFMLFTAVMLLAIIASFYANQISQKKNV